MAGEQARCPRPPRTGWDWLAAARPAMRAWAFIFQPGEGAEVPAFDLHRVVRPARSMGC